MNHIIKKNDRMYSAGCIEWMDWNRVPHFQDGEILDKRHFVDVYMPESASINNFLYDADIIDYEHGYEAELSSRYEFMKRIKSEIFALHDCTVDTIEELNAKLVRRRYSNEEKIDLPLVFRSTSVRECGWYDNHANKVSHCPYCERDLSIIKA